ncbi:hypothetical protein L210DRAFT_870480, partial [Boletus edulis BED1]
HISHSKWHFKICVSPELPPRNAHKKPTVVIFDNAMIMDDSTIFTGAGISGVSSFGVVLMLTDCNHHRCLYQPNQGNCQVPT